MKKWPITFVHSHDNIDYIGATHINLPLLLPTPVVGLCPSVALLHSVISGFRKWIHFQFSLDSAIEISFFATHMRLDTLLPPLLLLYKLVKLLRWSRACRQIRMVSKVETEEQSLKATKTSRAFACNLKRAFSSNQRTALIVVKLNRCIS